MVNDKVIKKLFEDLRALMISTEQIKNSLNGIPDSNFIAVRFKSQMSKLVNNILAEQLCASDYLFQILEVSNSNEWELVMDEFFGGGDE